MMMSRVKHGYSSFKDEDYEEVDLLNYDNNSASVFSSSESFIPQYDLFYLEREWNGRTLTKLDIMDRILWRQQQRQQLLL